MMAAKFAAEQNKLFGFNLSALFLLQFEFEKMQQVFEYTDFIFANEDEQAHLKGLLKVENIIRHVAEMPKKNLSRPKRTVVFTQGPKPTQVCIFDHSDQTCEEFEVEVPSLETEFIIDTNGAGDSFVGGFLAAHL